MGLSAGMCDYCRLQGRSAEMCRSLGHVVADTSVDALAHAEDMAGLLEHCLKKGATPAAMHTDRPCSARSLGTILSSLKIRTSPALAVQ